MHAKAEATSKVSLLVVVAKSSVQEASVVRVAVGVAVSRQVVKVSKMSIGVQVRTVVQGVSIVKAEP